MSIIQRVAFVSAWVIERAAALAPAVGRVVVNDGRGFGTGFLVSPRLILTCHHVIPDVATAMASSIEFDYRDDPSGRFCPVTRVAFDPTMVLADPFLDFAVIALREPLPGRLCVPLKAGIPVPIGQPVSLFHHPQAGPLRIGFQDGAVISADDTVIHHTAGSLPGSGGGPLFDERLQLIGLHHASKPQAQPSSGGAADPGEMVNEAIAIDAVCRSIAASGAPWAREALDHDGLAQPVRVSTVTAPSAAPQLSTELAETSATQSRSSVFISYARDDQPEGQWRERLRTFLQPFAARLDVWDDSRIQTGAQWRAEIDLALRRARVAVLLVGPHFLASDFIATNELPPLLEAAANDAVRILPLITNECSYSRTALSRYQTFHDPDEPLEGMERAKQNRILRKFAEQVSDALG